MAEIIKKSDIDKALALPASAGKKMLFKSASAPFGILEDHMVSNEAEVHATEGDLWYCMEGEVKFICNGEEFNVHSGDWLWIPPGESHQHSCEKTARLAIIKIPKT